MASKKKSTQRKVKEMFKPYDEDKVPESMPFPALWRVHSTKTQTTAVPQLSDIQRSWILDVALRGIDLTQLTAEMLKALHKTVKHDALEAKPFQHQPEAADRKEEAQLPKLVAAWNTKKGNKVETKKDDDNESDSGSDDSEDEADDAVQDTLLRGYTKTGWALAIQKVVSNKVSSAKTKAKLQRARGANSTEPEPGSSTPPASSPGSARAAEKLLRICAYTGRDKFRDECHDAIHEFSKTLSGSNAGGKFRKAERELWAKTDQRHWEEAAGNEQDVDWEERQNLIPLGFKQMVDDLNSSPKFHPFVALYLMSWLGEDGQMKFRWAESVPKELALPVFKETYKPLVEEACNTIYKWSEVSLRALELDAGRADTSGPSFPLTVEGVEDASPKALVTVVKKYLADSYAAAFGTTDIPWGDIETTPANFYDVTQFEPKVSLSRVDALTRDELYELGGMLAAVAGTGTRGLFRKGVAPARAAAAPPAPPETEIPVPPAGKEVEDAEAARMKQAEEAERQQREIDEGARRAEEAEEAARQQREAEKVAREREAEEAAPGAEEAAHQQREAEEAARQQREAEKVAREREAEEAAREREAEEAAREREAEKVAEDAARLQAGTGEGEGEGGKKKRGRKRKAEQQLLPEGGEGSGRPARDAAAERRSSAKLRWVILVGGQAIKFGITDLSRDGT
ncbi:hypothetical protein C8F04DRAFT_1183630 [Mycena alexandri]|uniref:Uncharacterized protein n=1 Tax=Mycena alexandri TaxID=1745969 RepID=A0AAD6X3C4_9AGAR|nr:hypothetical protein C8F04DRAFT_1183630 [Mycena alexandri]